ncbi:MAG: leucyl aminopeptidase [bacterium]
MDISFAKYAPPKSGALAIFVTEGSKLTGLARELDESLGGALGRAAKASRFKGGCGQFAELLAPPGSGLERVILGGLGSAGDLDEVTAEEAGGALAARLAAVPDKALALTVSLPEGKNRDEAVLAAHSGLGFLLRAHRFDRYRTTLKAEEVSAIKKVTVMAEDTAAARKAFKRSEAAAEGALMVRELVTEPANVLYPEEFARRCRELEKLGVEVEVLGEKQLKKLGMNALLGVGQGSDRESLVAVMRWNGGKTDDKGRPQGKPVAFVGKGVCFDTGGISIKPAQGMEDMKFDMGGAAVVTGLMHTLARRKAKVNAVGVIGLVENMPGGNAQRPGDVVKSMSGQTIEIINTDAEGRLVLADALWYTQDRFKPKFMIDIATLTGNIIVTFAHEYAGLFSSDDELAGRLTKAGKEVGEEVWRQPLGEAYDKMINSPVADVKNAAGREGGSITAAQFLKRFTNGVPWAHLDIAGMVWRTDQRNLHSPGATGFGVRLLDRLVSDYYEK